MSRSLLRIPMKKILFLLAVSGMAAMVGSGCSRGSSSAKGTPLSPGEAKNSIIGVEQFMEGPERFFQPVSIRGLVGQILPEKGLFSLVDLNDREELLKTGRTQCVTLPIRWEGPMPAIKDEVVVSGEIHKLDGKQIFVSTKVEKVVNDPQN